MLVPDGVAEGDPDSVAVLDRDCVSDEEEEAVEVSVGVAVSE